MDKIPYDVIKYVLYWFCDTSTKVRLINTFDGDLKFKDDKFYLRVYRDNISKDINKNVQMMIDNCRLLSWSHREKYGIDNKFKILNDIKLCYKFESNFKELIDICIELKQEEKDRIRNNIARRRRAFKYKRFRRSPFHISNRYRSC